MANEPGIDLLFNHTEPDYFQAEPVYLDVENIKLLEVYKKLPEMESFLQFCLSEYPHLNYQLFNYNIKHLKVKVNNGVFNKLYQLFKGEDEALHYNAVDNVLKLDSLENNVAVRIMLVNMLGSKCYTHQHISYYKQGFIYQMTVDLAGIEDVVASSERHFENVAEFNEAFDFYLCNRFFNTPDQLATNLRVVMCKIESLMVDDLLERYALADSVGLLNDLSSNFDEDEWIKFKVLIKYLFDLLRVTSVDNETEYLKLQTSRTKIYNELNLLLDEVITKKRNNCSRQRVLV